MEGYSDLPEEPERRSGDEPLYFNYGDNGLSGTNPDGDFFEGVDDPLPKSGNLEQSADHDAEDVPDRSAQAVSDMVITPREPDENITRQTRIREEFTALSGRFGELEDRDSPTVASNDHGLSEIVPIVKEDFQDREPGGLGLIVGSGTFSFLPETKIQPIIVDKNQKILKASEKLCDLIVEHDSPAEVIEKLRFPNGRDQFPDGAGEIMSHLIYGEAESFGSHHWTNPGRFEAVKEELIERRPTWVWADLTSEEFAEKVTDIADRYGSRFDYANFTNVHDWMVGKDPRPIIERLPFDPSAGIVFAKYIRPNQQDSNPFPTAHYRKGIGEYLNTIEGH